jgi:DNA-binding NarL/FixJ family response regulator
MQWRTVLLIRSLQIGWADIRNVVQRLEGVRVVGEVTTANDAIGLATEVQPDFIICGAELNGHSVQPLLVDIHHRASPATRIIVMSPRLEPALFSAVNDLAIVGYLLWSDLTPDWLRHCLLALITADTVVASRSVARAFVETRCRPSHPRPDAPHLTERERIILRHLAEELSREEIAAIEGVSLRTVERIISNLESKLNVSTQFALALRATEFGLIR